jgi:2-methylcitrate dehydratase PrpD
MNSPTIAEQLADFAAGLTLGDVPTAVVDQARLSLLDNLGVMVRGSVEPSTRPVRDVIVAMGGTRESTVAGTAHRVPAMNAALVNGTAAHSLELDDHISLTRSLGHRGVVSVPPALALSEALQCDGRRFLTAMIIGYEVTSRINDAVPPGFDNFERGFHGTAVTGTFGAAALSAWLLGSGAVPHYSDTIATAIGIAGTLTSGSFEYNASGAWTKRLHAGHSSRNGVLAGSLAHRGFTGPHSAIEGRHGFLASYMGSGNYSTERIVDKLGSRWALPDMMYKPFSCSGVLHASISAAQQLFNDGVDPPAIDHIVVRTNRTVLTEMAEPRESRIRPRTAVDAQFSLPYVVAVMLCRGGALLDEFSDSAITDPVVLATAAKVHTEVDPSFEAQWPDREPAAIEVRLNDGRVMTSEVAAPKGSLELPMTAAELRAKFRVLVEPVLGEERTETIIDNVAAVEHLEDVRTLACLLAT